VLLQGAAVSDARCSVAKRTRLQIPTAMGTLIGHFTGRVIWDISKPSCCKQPQPAIPHSAPGVSHYALHLLLGLGFGNGGDQGRGFGDGVHATFANAGVAGAVGGRLVGSGPRLGLGVTNELVIKLRECARPRLRDGSLR
jgi:hypothetical protein